MAVQTTYPGVYVQEVPSGVRTIAGVSTSVGLFIGSSRKGPMRKPVRCSSYTFFKDRFGEGGNSQLSQYVNLFFLNGGTDCYVIRIANGASSSSVTLQTEAGVSGALVLTAKEAGAAGEDIRAIVTYSESQPEGTFNIEFYQWETVGVHRNKVRREVWRNLSMDPASSKFAPTFLSQNSELVNAALPAAPVAPILGFSISGRPIQHAGTAASFKTAMGLLIGNTVATNRFTLTADGTPAVEIDLNNPVLNIAGLATAASLVAMRASIATEIKNRIQTQTGINVTVDFVNGPNAIAPNTSTSLLRITSTLAIGGGDIIITPAGSNDLTVPLKLGSEQGGLEVTSYSVQRPAPSGISVRANNLASLIALANLPQNTFTPLATGITLDTFQDPPVASLINFTNLVTTAPADLFYQDSFGVGSTTGNSDGIREKLTLMAAAINARAQIDPLFRWTAQVTGLGLTILPSETVADNFLSTNFANAGFGALAFLNNVKTYTLGIKGLTGKQIPGTLGSDGNPPLAIDYDNIYPVIAKDVDIFNLLVLPPDDSPAAISVQQLYGNASIFCRTNRAFLLMDPDPLWTTAQSATAGIAGARIGLVKDYSAIFFPQIKVRDNNLVKNIGPAGAMAGLFARIDATRGVWKSPAGIEADILGITGLRENFSDQDNGTLNPRAINTLRTFPSGIVCWGARTNFGDDNTPHDYKYTAIRRTACFIESSLERGLKWVVFEPNDEPLWAQIRLNVGAFMHNLFRQGAFQGTKKTDAYFVKCDAETTTQNDINLGIVNIWVGFAPLKPAEFVVLYIQQIAGNILV